MNKKDNHIILNQLLEIHFQEMEDGIGIQNRIAEIFYEKLMPRMIEEFDEIAGKNYLMKIERMEIDAGTLSLRNWEDEWVENTLRKLRDELRTRNRKQVEVDRMDDAEANEYFLYFLEHGHLPWNSRVNSLAELAKMVCINPALLKKMELLISDRQHTVERMVNSFSYSFVEKIVSSLAGDNIEFVQTAFSLLKKPVNEMAKKKFEIALIRFISSPRNEVLLNEFKQVTEEIFEEKDDLVESILKQQSKKYQKQTARQQIKKPEQEMIYIGNAGLVILHPFLPQLFEVTGLTNDNIWTDEVSKHLAVSLLQYLVTNEEELDETKTVLNKILCGMNSEEVLITGNILSAVTKKECEELLSELIRHWSVLKNTSTSALRETFLQRNGKLTRVNDGWLLQVEPKAVDILISNLPWGLGVVKLPWMAGTIYSEWM